MAKKPTPAPRDKQGNVLPLKHDALVLLKNKFRTATTTYEPNRFGVSIPAGTVLPKTALILEDNYAGEDVADAEDKQVKLDL